LLNFWKSSPDFRSHKFEKRKPCPQPFPTVKKPDQPPYH
jgi:hypothetical protein